MTFAYEAIIWSLLTIDTNPVKPQPKLLLFNHTKITSAYCFPAYIALALA